jgi:class 3 adenylate cyclase
MTQEGFKRKLTAILSADVIGYSRLMRDDEEATVRDLAFHRVLITEIIQQHHGRVVDSPGDNILAEFASVVDAVNGAIKIQGEIKKSNTGSPEGRRMEFRRIGFMEMVSILLLGWKDWRQPEEYPFQEPYMNILKINYHLGIII